MARRGDGIYQRGKTWWLDFTYRGASGTARAPAFLRGQPDPLEVDLDQTRHPVESRWGHHTWCSVVTPDITGVMLGR